MRSSIINTSTVFIVQAGVLWRGTSARELELIATFRLWLDIGGLVEKYPGSSLGILLLGNQER
jgi:hypothetical protein